MNYRRVLRYTLLFVAAAVWGWGAAQSKQRPAASCETDSECMAQCLRVLPINRPESECDL